MPNSSLLLYGSTDTKVWPLENHLPPNLSLILGIASFASMISPFLWITRNAEFARPWLEKFQMNEPASVWRCHIHTFFNKTAPRCVGTVVRENQLPHLEGEVEKLFLINESSDWITAHYHHVRHILVETKEHWRSYHDPPIWGINPPKSSRATSRNATSSWVFPLWW
jgi:hypothetical protein